MFGKIKFLAKVNQGGAGVGLSLCKELSKLINAEIHVQSEIGKGTKCTIVIQCQEYLNLNSQRRIKRISFSSNETGDN